MKNLIIFGAVGAVVLLIVLKVKGFSLSPSALLNRVGTAGTNLLNLPDSTSAKINQTAPSKPQNPVDPLYPSGGSSTYSTVKSTLGNWGIHVPL